MVDKDLIYKKETRERICRLIKAIKALEHLAYSIDVYNGNMKNTVECLNFVNEQDLFYIINSEPCCLQHRIKEPIIKATNEAIKELEKELANELKETKQDLESLAFEDGDILLELLKIHR